MTLDSKEIDKNVIKNSRIFHFGSLSMTHKPAASATLDSAKYAKEWSHRVLCSQFTTAFMELV
ncbi:hypothetical protein [Halalkalibacter lacteus]|uniref:hypothetical protein n=1 Tax=Halalkalibacter lacteus TaxID=3090663 RepID=UPI002FCB96D1